MLMIELLVADVDWATALASTATLLFTVGLTYLFYPAIRVEKRRPCRVEEVAAEQSLTTTTTAPIVLSIIIPSYNEELRLPAMLQEAYDYLTQPHCPALQDLMRIVPASRKNNNNNRTKSVAAAVEWIVVDDGSTDQTGRAFCKFVQEHNKSQSKQQHGDYFLSMIWKLVTLPQNSGKGAAVQAGMLVAAGSYCLMVDADGATDFAVGLQAMTQQLVSAQTESDTILLGSRAHLQPSNKEKALDLSLIRRALSAAFSLLRTITLGRRQNIVDTQCGFKLFPARTARAIFTALHLRRWAFDIEVLYLALHLDYPVQEVVVPWHEVEGSKLNTSPWNLAWVSLSMLRDMICVRLCYLTGIWSIEDGNSEGGMQPTFEKPTAAR